MFKVCGVCEHRCELPKLLMDFKTGVEVGVRGADYADVLLRGWPGFLHLIDPYEDYAEYVDTPQDHGFNLRRALRKLHPHRGRFRLHRERMSAALAERVGPVDFAYIDGNHAFEYVDLDIRVWWSKLRPGGILAGHDLFMVPTPDVTDAVVRFAAEVGRDVYIIKGLPSCPCGEGGHPSWYIRK